MARSAKKGPAVTQKRPLVSRRDPEPEMGPALRALPEKWRRAVENLLYVTDGNQTQALRLAGYQGTARSLTEMASRIFADDRVRAAVREVYSRYGDVLAVEARAVARKIMLDPTARPVDRLRAAGIILDRVDQVVSRHKIEVEHHVTDEERDMEHWRALKRLGAPAEAFLQRFGPNGVTRVEALVLAEEARRREIEAPTIEVDYDEVPNAG